MKESNSEILELLQKTQLFTGIPLHHLSEIVPLVQTISVSTGDFIMREGDTATEIYILKEGKLEVIKSEIESNDIYQISLLSPYDVFGEAAFLNDSTRSASVRALMPSTILALSIPDLKAALNTQSVFADNLHKLKELITEMESIRVEENSLSKISRNVTEQISKRLQRTNESMVKSLRNELTQTKLRLIMGNYLISVIFVIFCYSFFLSVLSKLTSISIASTLVTAPLILIIGAISAFTLHSTGYPKSTFGLTWKNGKRAAIEAIILSVIFLLLFITAKWILIETVSAFKEYRLFSLFDNIHTDNDSHSLVIYIFFIIIYALFTIGQEFIIRGYVQSSIQEFFAGKYKQWIVMLLPNVLFSMTHLHISLTLALIVFFPGLFWSWMYARQKTLVGVCISHMIIGVTALFFIGI